MSGDKPENIQPDAKRISEGPAISIAIVASRYNNKWTDRLCRRVTEVLGEAGIGADDIHEYRVPGAHEIPFLAKQVAELQFYDAIITLGVVMAGETDHHKVITESASHMLMQISCDESVPIINGILTVEKVEQLEDRIGEKYDRGAEFAHAALEMIQAVDEVSNLMMYESQFLTDMMDIEVGDVEDEDDTDWFKGN